MRVPAPGNRSFSSTSRRVINRLSLRVRGQCLTVPRLAAGGSPTTRPHGSGPGRSHDLLPPASRPRPSKTVPCARQLRTPPQRSTLNSEQSGRGRVFGYRQLLGGVPNFCRTQFPQVSKRDGISKPTHVPGLLTSPQPLHRDWATPSSQPRFTAPHLRLRNGVTASSALVWCLFLKPEFKPLPVPTVPNVPLA